MKKLLSALFLMALAAYGGFKAFVWYQAAQVLDDVKAVLAPYGALDYGWIGSSLSGEVWVEDVRLTPFVLKDTLAIDALVLKAPGLRDLLGLVSDVREQRIPDRLEWRVEGLRLGLSSAALDQWAADPLSQALTRVACGAEPALGPAAWRGMGYQELVSDVRFKYHFDRVDQTLTLDLRSATEAMSSTELMVKLKLDQVDLRFGDEVAKQPPQLTYARLSVEDDAYMSRVARYCRGTTGLDQAAYVAQSVREWEQALAALGVRLNEDFRQAYRLWLDGGKRVLIEMEPQRELNYGLLPFIKPAEALDLLGLSLRVGEYAVQDLAIEWNGQAVMKALQSEPPGEVATPTVARAPDPAPEPQASYRVVSYEELGGFLDYPVRIHTTQGKLFEGKLTAVEELGVQVGALVSGGIITYPVRRADITEMEVYR